MKNKSEKDAADYLVIAVRFECYNQNYTYKTRNLNTLVGDIVVVNSPRNGLQMAYVVAVGVSAPHGIELKYVMRLA